MNAQTPTPWQVKELLDLYTGRTVGFHVYRIHNPYTSSAHVEYLQPKSSFTSEAEARLAITKATGDTT